MFIFDIHVETLLYSELYLWLIAHKNEVCICKGKLFAEIPLTPKFDPLEKLCLSPLP